MGYKFVDWAWEQETQTPSEKLVLLALARRSNDSGFCWPSVARIALDTGVSERSVQRAIKTLNEREVIGVRTRKNNQRTTSSMYVLGGDKTTPSGATKCHPRGRQNDTPGGDKMTPELQRRTTKRNYKTAVSPDGPTATNLWRPEMNTSEQVLRNLKRKNADVQRPVTANVLAHLWAVEVPKHSGLKFIREPTRKELGQFAHIIRKVGKPDAVKVVSHAISNWPEFVDSTKRSAGVSSAPSAPHIGFLLRYCSEAASFLQRSESPVEASKPMKPQVAKAKAPKKPQEAPQKPTLEEVQQIVWGT